MTIDEKIKDEKKKKKLRSKSNDSTTWVYVFSYWKGINKNNRIPREKQAETWKTLSSTNKELPSIKDFVSYKVLDPEIMDELNITEKQEQKFHRN